MNKDKEDIEDVFRDRFSDEEADISPMVWNNIKQTLPPDTTGTGAAINSGFWTSKAKIIISSMIVGSTVIIGTLVWNYTKSQTENAIVLTEEKNKIYPGVNNKIINESIQKVGSNLSEEKNYKENDVDNSEAITINNKEVNNKEVNNKATSLLVDSNSKNETNLSNHKSSRAERTTQKRPLSTKDFENNTNDPVAKGESKTRSTVFTDNQQNEDNLNKSTKDSKNTEEVGQNTKVQTMSEEQSGNDQQKDSSFSTNNKGIAKDQMNQPIPTSSVNDGANQENKMNENFENNQVKNTESNAISTPTIGTPEKQNLKTDSSTSIVDSASVNKVDSIGNTVSETKNRAPGFSRISAELFLTPMLTGSTTKAMDDSYQSMVQNKNEQDKNTLNFAIGGGVNYSLHPRLNISLGFMYSNYKEKYNFKNSIPYDTTIFGQHLESDTIYTQDTVGNAVIDTIVQVYVGDTSVNTLSRNYSTQRTDQYVFISIPVTVSYYLYNKRRFSVFATAGVRFNFLLKGRTYIINEEKNGLIEIQPAERKLTLSYTASLGMEYRLVRNIYLLFRPGFTCQASSIFNSGMISQKPYSVDFTVGIRAKF